MRGKERGQSCRASRYPCIVKKLRREGILRARRLIDFRSVDGVCVTSQLIHFTLDFICFKLSLAFNLARSSLASLFTSRSTTLSCERPPKSLRVAFQYDGECDRAFARSMPFTT